MDNGQAQVAVELLELAVRNSKPVIITDRDKSYVYLKKDVSGGSDNRWHVCLRTTHNIVVSIGKPLPDNFFAGMSFTFTMNVNNDRYPVLRQRMFNEIAAQHDVHLRRIQWGIELADSEKDLVHHFRKVDPENIGAVPVHTIVSKGSEWSGESDPVALASLLPSHELVDIIRTARRGAVKYTPLL